MLVRLSGYFREDLSAVIDYLLKHSTPEKSQQLRDAVYERLLWLERHPRRGRTYRDLSEPPKYPGPAFGLFTVLKSIP